MARKLVAVLGLVCWTRRWRCFHLAHEVLAEAKVEAAPAAMGLAIPVGLALLAVSWGRAAAARQDVWAIVLGGARLVGIVAVVGTLVRLFAPQESAPRDSPPIALCPVS